MAKEQAYAMSTLSGVETSDLELIGEDGSALQEPRNQRLRLAAKVAAGTLAFVALAGAGARAAWPQTVSLAAPADAVRFDGEMCRDTPGWVNGYTACSTNGYKGVGCEAGGLTCEAYAANKWCVSGTPMRAWAIGADLNSPELNCCVCGGGVQGAGELPTAAPAAPTAVPLSPVSPAKPAPVTPLTPATPGEVGPASCSAWAACKEAGLEGNCCPNDDQVSLECCNSARIA